MLRAHGFFSYTFCSETCIVRDSDIHLSCEDPPWPLLRGVTPLLYGPSLNLKSMRSVWYSSRSFVSHTVLLLPGPRGNWQPRCSALGVSHQFSTVWGKITSLHSYSAYINQLHAVTPMCVIVFISIYVVSTLMTKVEWFMRSIKVRIFLMCSLTEIPA